MNKDDLLKMLDLNAGLAKPAKTLVPVMPTESPKANGDQSDVEWSDHAVKVDRWDEVRGARLATKHKEMGLSAEEWTDFHTTAFSTDPQVLENCTDARRLEFVKTLLETPDFKTLRKSTVLNELASEMAATNAAESWVKLKAVDKRNSTPSARDKRSDKAKEHDRMLALLAAVGDATAEAAEEVEQLENVGKAIGIGQGGDNKMNLANTVRVYNKVKNSERLRKICELAGRYRMMAQAKQRQKVTHGFDEMIGVEMSGDISRLLPVELASLSDETLEMGAMRRLVEKQSMSREYRGSEKVGKGPIVVCVDESGSMHGDPICNAKAFALSMAWIARKQGRWCALVGYSGGTEGTLCVLPPNKWDEVKLLEWLEHFYSGGTHMDVPLQEMPTTYWQQMKPPKGKTDVILITDAECYVGEQMEKNFNDWKLKEKVKCITLVIGADAGDLKKVSDEVHLIPNIGVEQEAIGRCLSI